MSAWVESAQSDMVWPAFGFALREVESVTAGRTANVNVPEKNVHYSYKYANLADVLAEVGRVCENYALAVTQTPGAEGGDVLVWTRIIHTSGQWIETAQPFRMKSGGTPQGAGSALTYARRYALTAVFNIAVEDDDAATAEHRLMASRQPAARQAPSGQPQPSRGAPAQPRAVSGRPGSTANPVGELFSVLNAIQWKDATANFRRQWGFPHTAIPDDALLDCIGWANEEVQRQIEPQAPADDGAGY